MRLTLIKASQLKSATQLKPNSITKDRLKKIFINQL